MHFTAHDDLQLFALLIAVAAILVFAARNRVPVAILPPLLYSAAISGLSWASAFTLGAIVSPTDALASTEVARRLGVPRRIASIIEGATSTSRICGSTRSAGQASTQVRTTGPSGASSRGCEVTIQPS